MLPVWILYVGFCFSILESNAQVNGSSPELQFAPQNLAPPVFNYNIENRDTQNIPLPFEFQPAANPQNEVYCPNTALLLNIVNMLADSLPNDPNTIMDPEKFKYVLSVARNFLEKTVMNPENGINGNYNIPIIDNSEFNDPIQVPHYRTGDNLRAQVPFQYQIPGQSNQNCRDIFNNFINIIIKAYTQVLRYCLQHEKCSGNNGMNIPSNSNGIYNINPFTLIRNSTSIWPIHNNLAKESVIAGADLINFIKMQQGNGFHDIMSILNNYRPSEVTNIPANELKIPNDVYKPLPNQINLPSNQISNFYQSINEFSGKNSNLQPSNIYYPPNINTDFGNTYENQQYVNLKKKMYAENNVAFTNFINSGIEKSMQPINGQIFAVNPGIPIINPKGAYNINPNINNVLTTFPNPLQNLYNTKIKIDQGVINKAPNFEDSTRQNIHQYLQELRNINSKQLEKPMLPQQSMYPAYGQNQILTNQLPGQSSLGFNQNGWGYNQYGAGLSHNGVGVNQINPFTSIFNNGQNVFTDYNKQEKYDGQLLELNQLLGIANQDKLNAIPIKNGIVELTYLLKRPKPVYEPHYYIKYRIPYQTFLYNLHNSLSKKPLLRNEPNKLYQELLVGANVTDASNSLKGLNYEGLLKLTSTNGTLVTAKILDSNDATVNQTLKLVQKLNSRLPVDSIIKVNVNATKSISNADVPRTPSSEVKNLVNDINYPTLFDKQRRLYPNLNYPYTLVGQYPRVSNPHPVYQSKPGLINMPTLKYVNGLPVNTITNPTLYSPYNLLRNYPQLGR